MTSTSDSTEQGRIASARERVGSAASSLRDKAAEVKKRRAENGNDVNPVFAFAFVGLAAIGAGKVLGLGFRGARAGVRAVKARRA